MRAALVVAILLGTSCADPALDAHRRADGSTDAEPCTMCDGRCVPLGSDPHNCGACGRTCVVPNAAAACVSGECAVGACSAGWLDCNTEASDGCEHADACTPGRACTTACGSSGTEQCADRCGATCVPPAEVCNAADDDCNGACDEGPLAGCRRGVHRVFRTQDHFYTTDRAEAERAGRVEFYDFFFLYAAEAGGMSPLFRCLTGRGTHLYTTDTACEMNGRLEGTMGFLYRSGSERCGAIPLYRLHKPDTDDHFYTTSAAERDNAVRAYGYVDRGVTGWVWPAP